MSGPVRIQLSRAKGFRLQEVSLALNGLPAVKVDRSTRLGNPFTKAAALESGYATEATWQAFVVECFRDWLGPSHRGRLWWQGPESDRRRRYFAEEIDRLRGQNLACWCKLPKPGEPDICHAAILLELANREPTP